MKVEEDENLDFLSLNLLYKEVLLYINFTRIQKNTALFRSA